MCWGQGKTCLEAARVFGKNADATWIEGQNGEALLLLALRSRDCRPRQSGFVVGLQLQREVSGLPALCSKFNEHEQVKAHSLIFFAQNIVAERKQRWEPPR